jgi:hypothetical protein
LEPRSLVCCSSLQVSIGTILAHSVRTWNQRSMAEAGLPFTWVQGNFSVSKNNVLPGIRYHVKQPQGKLVRVTGVRRST